jgi:hypothetical protein
MMLLSKYIVFLSFQISLLFEEEDNSQEEKVVVYVCCCRGQPVFLSQRLERTLNYYLDYGLVVECVEVTLLPAL